MEIYQSCTKLCLWSFKGHLKILFTQLWMRWCRYASKITFSLCGDEDNYCFLTHQFPSLNVHMPEVCHYWFTADLSPLRFSSLTIDQCELYVNIVTGISFCLFCVARVSDASGSLEFTQVEGSVSCAADLDSGVSASPAFTILNQYVLFGYETTKCILELCAVKTVSQDQTKV